MQRSTVAALVLAAMATAAATPAQGQRAATTGLGVTTPRLPTWRFEPRIGFAYDSFGQRYEIADEDTLDLINEMSGRIVTLLERSGTIGMRAQNTFVLGEQANRNDLQLLLTGKHGRTEWRFQDDLRLKIYRSGSDYTFSSDYLVNTGRGAVAWDLGSGLRLRVEDRLEIAHVAERSRYNYDYLRNDTRAELEKRYGLFSSLRGSYEFGTRSVPDSSRIDFTRHQVWIDGSHGFGLHSVGFEHVLERRSYRDADLRSPYVDYEGRLRASLSLRPGLRLRPEYRGAVLHYDRPDSIYTSATEQVAELAVEKELGTGTTLSLGPRAEFRRTDSSVDRAYNQWSVKATLTWFAGTRLWVQFSDEIGQREHLAGDDLLYTDYVFNWSTLYLTWEVVPRLTWDVFFSLNPESHEVRSNDTTTLLLSTALTWSLTGS